MGFGKNPFVMLLITGLLATSLVASAIVQYFSAITYAEESLKSRIDDFVSAFTRSARAADFERGVLNRLSRESTTSTVLSLVTHDKNCRVIASSKTQSEKTREDSTKRCDQEHLQLWHYVKKNHAQLGAVMDVCVPLAPDRPRPPKIQIEPIGDIYGPLHLHLRANARSITEQEHRALLHIIIVTAVVVLLTGLVFSQIRRYNKEIQLQRKLREEEKFASLGRMSAVLAHEIRNPLGSIKGYAQLLGEGYEDDEPKKQGLEIIVKETAHLERLVKNLLSYARPITLHLSGTSLRELFERSAYTVSQNMEQAVVELQLGGIPTQLQVYVDPELMRQVFVNLLLNATAACKEGGTITVMASTSKQEIEILIQDSGIGIPPELQARIFEPFVTTRAKGTGLGLAISKKIIEIHGGMITLKESHAKGTSFKIQLPLKEHIRES